MNVYQPEDIPPLKPLVWDKNETYMVPHSRGAWNDFQLRCGMEHALQLDEELVLETTKALAESGLAPLHAVSVCYPFVMPPVSYDSECMTDQQMRENAVLRDFAFDAQDVLKNHFESDTWCDWFVAPYFTEGDDAHNNLWLGVFVDDGLAQEVIE